MWQENSVSWIVFFLRLTLRILFFFSGTAHFFEIHFFVSPVGDVQPWFPINYYMYVSKVIAVVLVLLCILLAVGYRTSSISMITVAFYY